jgi:putative transcriptional regulator
MNDPRLERMQKMAVRFNQTGTVDQLTLRKINALCLDDDLQMNAARIKAIREKENISQGVLARLLNMSCESVKKWEQGKTTPQGAAARLLSIIDHNGINAIL